MDPFLPLLVLLLLGILCESCGAFYESEQKDGWKNHYSVVPLLGLLTRQLEEQEGDHFVCLLQMMDGGTDVAAAAAHKESPWGSKTMWQNECDYVSNYRMICQKGRLIDKIMAAELYGAH